jgi:hypothetical protein
VTDSRRKSKSAVAGAGYGSTVDSSPKDASVVFVELPALVSPTSAGSTVHALDVESVPDVSKQYRAGCCLPSASTSVDKRLITVSMSTPSTLKELLWKRVGCSYKAHGSDKVVLQDVSGCALSGEFIATFTRMARMNY